MKSKVTDQQLRDYVREGLTVPEIAKRQSMAECTVHQRLKQLGIQAVNAHRKKQGYRDQDMVRLANEGFSQAEIGRELGLSSGADLHGIKRLNLVCLNGTLKQRKFSDNDLLDLVARGLTKNQIAYELDVNESSVRTHAARLNVKLLTANEVKERQQKALLQRFVDDGLCAWDAAKETGIANSTIIYWANKYGFQLPDGRQDIGAKISASLLHSSDHALDLLKQRTNDAFRLAEGETYVDSHQTYRFYCVEHKEVHVASWTQIAYGKSGLKCCGEAQRLLQGWDNLPDNFVDPGDETWVYVYRTSVDGFCKVGISTDVEKRASNGGKVVYREQYDKVLCSSRLQARLLEEAVLWEFRSESLLPECLIGQSGWSEIINAEVSEVWKVLLDLFDAYVDESVADFCSRFLALNPLTLVQIEQRCADVGVDWKSQK